MMPTLRFWRSLMQCRDATKDDRAARQSGGPVMRVPGYSADMTARRAIRAYATQGEQHHEG
jgi:uncharacterized protein YodC (DUF2158 family)